MTTQVLGLDIGGANLKAAHSDGTARSIAFPLWKHPDRLTAELASLCAAMPSFDCLAVTMTGELCDCFETKSDGVRAILQSVSAVAVNVRVWCTTGRFLTIEQALADPLPAAAANWLALAHWVAQRFADERVMLIDTGSTTTDIVYLNHGVPEARARSDPERLESGELVYTGVRRTSICAVLGVAVAAEFFATMQDAYVLRGLLPENADDRDTADGRPATRVCCHARLARMRCADRETFTEAQALELADLALAAQWQAVGDAIERVAAGKPPVQRIVVSGSGEVLGRCVSAPMEVTSIADLLGPALSEAACAYAVAMLAAEELRDAR